MCEKTYILTVDQMKKLEDAIANVGKLASTAYMPPREVDEMYEYFNDIKRILNNVKST